jgi:hypothetical protein
MVRSGPYKLADSRYNEGILPSGKSGKRDDNVFIASDIEVVGEVDGDGDGFQGFVRIKGDRNILEESH